MTRVVALILHAGAGRDAGPLERAFEAIRRANGARHVAGFRAAGAEACLDDAPLSGSFGDRIRQVVASARPDGLVVLGSGALPLTSARDRGAFVAVAGGPAGRALANNRYSADIVAVSPASVLSELPDITSDNGLPRWLAEHGIDVDDLRTRWRLQLDLDSPLDGLLVRPVETAGELTLAGIDSSPVRAALAGVAAAARDPGSELVVAGRASAAGLAWLEGRTASRTRALVEERGFRTRRGGERPVRSTLGLLVDRDGPAALAERLAELGDAALVDSRVLLAHRFGPDERAWPPPEDRFASDLLLPERIADPWLRALTAAVRDASIPIVLGGHTLVGPGLRLALRKPATWT